MDTRVTVISDTHWRHDELDLPAGDLLIHCGDMFDLFSRSPLRLSRMDAWFRRQPFETILYTGGNHDRELEAAAAHRAQPLKHARFLRGETVEVRGLKIFGAPWVPDLARHAFFQDRPSLARSWAQIPPRLDILVTHTPPQGILDRSRGGQSHGCAALAAELPRIAPRVHCFGHVHASAGQHRIGDTLFINASSIESGTGSIRPPMTFTLQS
ncbi:MAG: hypothetical protein DCF31_16730 [Alphaproteobacteria bacterium]|nr:MAG: hypothetical protein DCF31_16730 [Alphaproteobacteria bacterium]